ncbi:GAF and HD-GYP domain-containing protein, partial [Spirochaetota bacterium]
NIVSKASKEIKEIRIPKGQGICGWVADRKKPLVVNDVSSDKRFFQKADKKSKFQTRSILAVPLMVKSECIGVLELINKKNYSIFTPHDTTLLTALANNVAIAIHNAQLFEDQKEMFMSVVNSFAAAIDAKDHYTHGHSERVTRYSLKIAGALDMSQEEIDKLELAALLHDIGKIGINTEVLNKPGRLSPDERAYIEKHPGIGYDIIRHIKQFENIIAFVRHHHERYDGCGYPDRLKGQQIPLHARIIAIADTYDAMTSNRPYRKRMPKKLAMHEIRKNAGTQFDKKLTNIFLKII